jgi:hypothetical protein
LGHGTTFLSFFLSFVVAQLDGLNADGETNLYAIQL